MTAAPQGHRAAGDRVVVAVVTGPDRETLVEIGRRVVEERLAACANVWGPVASVFRWKGEVEEEAEVMALLKTTADRVEDLGERVVELHPYDVPEFLVLPVSAGSADYLAWVVGAASEDGGG